MNNLFMLTLLVQISFTLVSQVKSNPEQVGITAVPVALSEGSEHNKINADQNKPSNNIVVPNEKKQSITTPNADSKGKIQNQGDTQPGIGVWSKNVQESNFLTSGMMILLSISLLFMIFVAYKTYRRKSRNARIQKYGVRLTRGNIEMTPLPLDNDDDDETVFDLKNVPI